LEEKQLKKDNPKRRKAKDNPYTIYFCKETGKYFLSFKDGQGKYHRFEIDKSFYDAFDGFELEDLSMLNEFDNHTEHSELTDASLNKRAFYKPESVEDTVIHKLQDESLHKAIAELPKTQRRRLQLYYFGGLTYGQIAEMEGCKYQAVQDSIYTALNTLKNYFSK